MARIGKKTKNADYNRSRYNYWFTYDLLTLVLLAYISVNPSNILSIIVVALLVIGLALKEIQTSLLTMIMLFPFEYVMNISGNSLMFIVNLVFVFAVVFKKRDRKISIIPVISFLVIFSIEFFNSGINGVGIGTLIHWATILMVFITVILYIDHSEWNNYLVGRYFGVSYLIVIFATFYASGSDFSVFLNNTNNLVISESRFGFSLSSLGGAMGISFYSAINISILLNEILNKNQSVIDKVFSVVLLIVSMIIGLVSVSRMFFLELAFIMTMFYMHVLFSRKHHRKINILIINVFLVFVAYYFLGEYIEVMIYRMVNRLSSASLDIRSAIQLESLAFLFTNPFNLMFGLGVNYYPKYGEIHGYLFQAHTHNLYLDAFMGWGIVGVVFFILTLVYYVKKHHLFNLKKNNIINFLPAITIFTWYMTAGTFSSYRDYVFILIALNLLSPTRRDILEK